MKKSILITVLTLVIFTVMVTAQDKTAKYVGSEKCKVCHKAASRGDQYSIWEKSLHAKAYATLATEQSKEVAKKAGVTSDPQKAAQCLKCHVTAYEAPATAIDASFKQSEGVGCEVCHGPGSIYKTLKIMKDLAAGVQDPKAVGFIAGDEATCLKCHNTESPTYKEFKYDVDYAKIAHPLPDKTK
ncbi:MAG TPA: cytochrome c family protein [bacterium]|nr:cytochrome c family protein [bacterium]HPN43431.1 cytochrome c family protein [bacterium]